MVGAQTFRCDGATSTEKNFIPSRTNQPPRISFTGQHTFEIYLPEGFTITETSAGRWAKRVEDCAGARMKRISMLRLPVFLPGQRSFGS
jgi:hypothetical protein